MDGSVQSKVVKPLLIVPCPSFQVPKVIVGKSESRFFSALNWLVDEGMNVFRCCMVYGYFPGK